MNKIRLTFFGNFVLKITLVFAIILTFALGIFNRYFIGGEEGKLVFYTMCVMVLLQIPTSIFLFHRISKLRDYFVEGNELINQGEVICTRKDIISIKKINLIKTEIKYIKDSEEKVIYVTIGNKKLNEIKTLLSIDN